MIIILKTIFIFRFWTSNVHIVCVLRYFKSSQLWWWIMRIIYHCLILLLCIISLANSKSAKVYDPKKIKVGGVKGSKNGCPCWFDLDGKIGAVKNSNKKGFVTYMKNSFPNQRTEKILFYNFFYVRMCLLSKRISSMWIS